MPLYEYLCESCGRRSEVLQKLNDPPITACPHCGGAVKKQMSAPAFQFKGSGWYVTDYAKKSGGGESSGSGASSARSEGASSTSESKSGAEPSGATKSESKPESKSESRSETKSESKSESKSETKSESKT